MTDNGAVRGRPKVIEIELDSGVMVHVTPLNLWVYGQLQQAALEKYPDPDKAAYEEELPDAASPDIKIPAEENPEYQTVLTEVYSQRVTYILEWLLRRSLKFPEGEEKLRERFAELVADIQDLTPDLDLSDWLTFVKCILISPVEMNLINAIVQDRLPVTEVEVRAAYRLFRTEVQWSELVRSYGRDARRLENERRLERLKKQLAAYRGQPGGGGAGSDQRSGDESGAVLRDEPSGQNPDGGVSQRPADSPGAGQQVSGTGSKKKTGK